MQSGHAVRSPSPLCPLFVPRLRGRENHWPRWIMPTTARQEKAAAVAAGAVPKPRGKAPKAYPLWDTQRGVWTNDAGDIQPSKKRAVGAVLDDAAAAAASTTAPRWTMHPQHQQRLAGCSTPPESPMDCAATSAGTIPHERPGMQRFLRNPWRDEVPLMHNMKS